MVFGNKGDNSGTGVCFTRDPNSGENVFYGDYLINAQGEDVVAGIRTPLKLSDARGPDCPRSTSSSATSARMLEKHYKEMQDLEFTIEDEKLYMLQCRTGKRSPAAAFDRRRSGHQACSTGAGSNCEEGLSAQAVGGMAVKPVLPRQASPHPPEDIERLFYPVIDTTKVSATELKASRLASGINAVPGAAAGKVVFTAAEAEAMAKAGEKVILVRKETSPEDVGGMHAAKGILTATGGKT